LRSSPTHPSRLRSGSCSARWSDGVAAYLEEKIWQPIGVESDATWLIDNSGQEATFCCLNAVLRDYARLRLLLPHDGNWRGRQIIPATWIMAAMTVREDQPHLRPGRAIGFWGYGYQTWIYPFPDECRMFAFQGVRGQAIYVDLRSRVVMVHTAVRKQRSIPAFAKATRSGLRRGSSARWLTAVRGRAFLVWDFDGTKAT